MRSAPAGPRYYMMVATLRLCICNGAHREGHVWRLLRRLTLVWHPAVAVKSRKQRTATIAWPPRGTTRTGPSNCAQGQSPAGDMALSMMCVVLCCMSARCAATAGAAPSGPLLPPRAVRLWCDATVVRKVQTRNGGRLLG